MIKASAGTGMRWRIKWGLVLPILLAPLGLGGCDPCSGVAACEGGVATRIDYEGDLILRFANSPAAAIRVDFVRTGGGTLLPRDSVTVFTDSVGKFRIEGEVLDGQTVMGKLVIHQPAPLGTVVYEDLPLVPTAVATETRYMGSWRLDHPHFGSFGEVIYRNTLGRADGVEVEFRRRGGVSVEPSTFLMRTDVGGRFPLSPLPRDTGEIVFDLIFRPPPPYRPATYENQRMRALVGSNPNPFMGPYWIGPHMPYLGLLVWGDTGAGAVGVEVEFRRISGIEVEPDRYVTQSNQWANFSLGPVPRVPGSVRVELTIRPPAPYQTVVDTIVITTTDENTANVLYGTWAIPRR
jgi:hypothetical protein